MSSQVIANTAAKSVTVFNIKSPELRVNLCALKHGHMQYCGCGLHAYIFNSRMFKIYFEQFGISDMMKC